MKKEVAAWIVVGTILFAVAATIWFIVPMVLKPVEMPAFLPVEFHSEISVDDYPFVWQELVVLTDTLLRNGDGGANVFRGEKLCVAYAAFGEKSMDINGVYSLLVYDPRKELFGWIPMADIYLTDRDCPGYFPAPAPLQEGG